MRKYKFKRKPKKEKEIKEEEEKDDVPCGCEDEKIDETEKEIKKDIIKNMIEVKEKTEPIKKEVKFSKVYYRNGKQFNSLEDAIFR